MKTALVTTTINIPRVLELYRKIGPDVRFFVACDEKTPPWPNDFGKFSLCMTPGYQKALNYKSSELIGWNNDSRRNIALLEAVKWGADIIVSADDDMIPCTRDCFIEFERVLSYPFSGLELGSPGNWFDAGRYTIPQARQRGLPVGCATDNSGSFVCDARVGAMQGIILGTPDTDAVTTIVNAPSIVGVTDILKAGFVVDLKAKAIFNSQFTAFRRELAPCFAQFYKWQGRNTDIFSSLIMRRVMREMNLYTYYGPPMGFHARTQRDPLKDLKAEMWGLEHAVEFQQWLDEQEFLSGDKTALAMTRRIWEGMSDTIVPHENIDCALAFLDDMEGVL